ncbi:MAG: aspartate/glutamate racemase family protein [Gammaproteobacteria bacterium]
MSPRVTLIHAVTVAIPPVLGAFREGWPDAEVSNLLDDGLTGALAREGGLTPRIAQRIRDLATYAARSGADGILFTCSAFTPAMDQAREDVTIPLLKPDEAMFADALEAGRRIGVVATFPGTIPVAEPQIRAAAAARGIDVEIVSMVAPEAFTAMNAADTATHDRLVVDAAVAVAPRVDVICLAQFSMARARAAVQSRVAIPVLTSPAAAVQRLRSLLS